MGDAVQLEQLKCLGVLASRHGDLVPLRLEQRDQRPEERHVR
jgi:hypothetical protein